MKHLQLFMMGLMVSGATIAYGQQRDAASNKRIEKEEDRISQIIPDLTEKQKEEIKKARLEHYADAKEWKREKKAQRGRMHQKRMEIKKERRTNYKQILTKEQYIKLLEHRAARKEMKRFRKDKKDRAYKKHDGRHHKRSDKIEDQ